MPTPITIPKISGLEDKLSKALARRDLALSNIHDATLSVESFAALQNYMTKAAATYARKAKNPAKQDDEIKALAILIANKIAQLVQKDQELSSVNRQENAANFRVATTREHSGVSLGTHLEQGGDVASFGWADESLPTIISDLASQELKANKVVILGPLQDLQQARQLTDTALRDAPEKTDAMAFVRTGGNHWQLLHTERSEQGVIKTAVFNPQGDGACGHRAAAECLSRLRDKHDMQFGLAAIVPSNGDKKAVMDQVAILYRHINASLPETSTAIEAQAMTAPDPSKTELEDNGVTPLQVAAQELESTGAILSKLPPLKKLSAIISSQQKEFDHWAQVKADHLLAETLQEQYTQEGTESALPNKTSTPDAQLASDETLARQLQAKFDFEAHAPAAASTPKSCRQEAASSGSAVSPPKLTR